MITLIELLTDNDRKDDMKLEYGNENILTLKTDDELQLTEDNWLIVNDREYLKLDSVYRVSLIPAKVYVYAVIPSSGEVSRQILEILSDNEQHRTGEVKKLLVENVVLSKEKGKKFSEGKLKEKIDWISSFEISKLKKSGFVESKRWGYLNITPEGLGKLD